MATSNVYNTGIMHWRPGHVGKPACGTNRAIMAMDTADFEAWPRKCRKCEAKLNHARSREAAKKTLCQPVDEIIARIEAMRAATEFGSMTAAAIADTGAAQAKPPAPFDLTRYLNQLGSAHLYRIELAAVSLASEIGADDFEGWEIYNNPLPAVFRDFVIEHTYPQWRADYCDNDPTDRDLLAVEAAWRIGYPEQARAFDEALAAEVAA